MSDTIHPTYVPIADFDEIDAFEFTSPVYGIGFMFCWYLVVGATAITWMYNPRYKTGPPKLTKTFIAAGAYPTFAAIHAFTLLHDFPSSREAVLGGDLLGLGIPIPLQMFSPRPDLDAFRQDVAVNAPIQVCQQASGFAIWGLLILLDRRERSAARGRPVVWWALIFGLAWVNAPLLFAFVKFLGEKMVTALFVGALLRLALQLGFIYIWGHVFHWVPSRVPQDFADAIWKHKLGSSEQMHEFWVCWLKYRSHPMLWLEIFSGTLVTPGVIFGVVITAYVAFPVTGTSLLNPYQMAALVAGTSTMAYCCYEVNRDMPWVKRRLARLWRVDGRPAYTELPTTEREARASMGDIPMETLRVKNKSISSTW